MRKFSNVIGREQPDFSLNRCVHEIEFSGIKVAMVSNFSLGILAEIGCRKLNQEENLSHYRGNPAHNNYSLWRPTPLCAKYRRWVDVTCSTKKISTKIKYRWTYQHFDHRLSKYRACRVLNCSHKENVLEYQLQIEQRGPSIHRQPNLAAR